MVNGRFITDAERDYSHPVVMRGMSGEPMRCATTEVTLELFGQPYQVCAAVMDSLPVDAALGCDLPLWKLMQDYQQEMQEGVLVAIQAQEKRCQAS